MNPSPPGRYLSSRRLPSGRRFRLGGASPQLELNFEPQPEPVPGWERKPGLDPDPEYRAWLRQPALPEWQMEIVRSWAKELRAAWLDRRPHGIIPEPKYRWMLDAAALLAGI